MIFERDGAFCRMCGTTDWLTIDHIDPVSNGGSNDPANLQVLCRACNTRKGGVRRQRPASLLPPRPARKPIRRMDDRLMTMTQLADYLQVSTKTIQRWIKAGMPVLNAGSPARPDWRFSWGKVEAWLDERGKPAPPPPKEG